MDSAALPAALGYQWGLRNMSETYLPRQPRQTKLPSLSAVLKIANPTVIESEPPPEPKPHSIPRMSMGLEKPAINVPLQVLRVSQGDVMELARWVEDKFVKRFPDVTAELVEAYLRMAVSRNEYAAFRTVQAWGVVCIGKHPFQKKSYAELMFLVSKHPVQDEILALLRQMFSWAKSHGCGEFRLSEFSDYDLEPIRKKLNMTDSDETFYMSI